MIALNETEITGKWFMSHGRAVADETCQRIVDLTNGYLLEVCRDSSGWDTLYRDPNDGRFWELIYPQGDLQGGGPPQLRCLLADEAKGKYGGDLAVS